MVKYRLKRMIFILFLLTIRDIAIVLIILNSSWMQNKITESAIEIFTEVYEIDAKVGGADIKLPNKIALLDVEINDSIGDKILSSKKIGVEISLRGIMRKRIFIRNIEIIEPYIYAKIDQNGIANYMYIFNKFKTGNDKQFKYRIFCNDLTITDGHLKYRDLRKDSSDKFCISDIDIQGFCTNIQDFNYWDGDSLKVTINNFTLNERCGVEIDSLSAIVNYSKTGFSLENFIFKTSASKLICSEINVVGKDDKYLQDIVNGIENLNIDIDTLIVSATDIDKFLPIDLRIDDSILMSGNISGKLENFKFKNIKFNFRNDTRFYANLSINGLPDYDQTIVFGNISNLKTSKDDINQILKAVSTDKQLRLPKQLNDLTEISFNGNLTGMLSDMVAYGSFKTNLGSIKTDIAIVTDFDEKKISYDGVVNADNFNLNKIFDNEKLGLVSFNSTIKGSYDSLKYTYNTLDCNITKLGFNGYNYSYINVKGVLSNDYVDGSVLIGDPNLNADFSGKYNFKSKEQEVIVNSALWADLKALNLVSDTINNSTIRFTIDANVHGDLISQPFGYVRINDFKHTRDRSFIVLDNFDVSGRNDIFGENYILDIKSDYINASVKGKFFVNEVVQQVRDMISAPMPVFTGEPQTHPMTCPNYMTIDVTLQNLHWLTEFFMPELKINGNIRTQHGHLSCEDKNFYSEILVPSIDYKDIAISKSLIKFYLINGVASIDMENDGVVRKNLDFDNIKLALNATDNKLNLNLNWQNNAEKMTNFGYLDIASKFSKDNDTLQPKVEVQINPSQFITGSNVWKIDKTNIVYDNKEIEVENFKLSNAFQELNVKGFISKDESKVLNFLINNIDVSNFNIFTEKAGYEFAGILNGNGRIANVYDTPIFTTSVNISDFMINQESFGDFNLSSKWENTDKAFTLSGSNKYMNIKGLYKTRVDTLDISVALKNLKLNILEKYLNRYELSNIYGDASGNIRAIGKLKSPQIDGFLTLQRSSLTYNYLKLTANITDTVWITNDKFIFKDFEVTDYNGNKALINGDVSHNNFKDFKFNLAGNLDDFGVMNTKSSDNELFYGTIFASGGLNFEGNTKDISIYAAATTEENSKFVLPMENSYSSKGTSFITFLSNDTTTVETNTKKKSNLKYKIALDVNVQPETEIQIVFDPKVGDKIRGYGEGILKIEYTSDDDLYMYGDIEIKKGDYLFTLENIINKKFTVNQGGTIKWSGDPYNGILNLDAVYTANASLKDLMTEEYDTTDMYNQKATVECHMHMTGKLMSPEIQFSIEIPNANDKVKTKLASLTQDETNKQLLYLLVMNQFYNANQTSDGMSQFNTTTNAVGVTTTEMLSNQLSNWVSQILKDVDLGVKYTPGTEVSGRELEVALSTQIFNDRLLINGNLGITDKKYNNEGLIGDVEVQWKLNKKGTIRLKGFSRTNTDIESEYGPYTTGAGIFYTDEYDKFSEVLIKAWNTITFKNAREKHKAKKVQANQ